MGQLLLKPDVLQKRRQRKHLTAQIFRVPEAALQALQRRNHLIPYLIQPCQRLPGVVIPLPAEALGMAGPALRPFAAADAPDHRVIFQLIAGVGIHRRQGRTQIAQRLPLVKAADGGIQRRQNRVDDAVLQDFLRAGAVERNMEPVKYQIHQRLVGGQICADHRNIPVAAALFHQLPDPLGGIHTLLPGRLRLYRVQDIRKLAGSDSTLKQAFPHRIQKQLIGGNHFHLDLHPGAACQPVKLSGGVPRLFKGQQAGFQAVAVHADGDLRGCLHEVVENCQILPGKIRETVYVKYVFLGKGAVLQLLQQPGHLVPGVPLAPPAQAVVAVHQQRQLLQLLGKTSLRLPGGIHQVLRGDAAAFELVHRVNESRQKLRLCFHGGIGLQAAAELSGSRRHSDHPAAVIQTFCRRAAHGVGNPPRQPGKGQHLRITAGSIPGKCAQPPLCLMADKLRNHENSVSLPFPDITGYSSEHLIRIGGPVPPQQQMHHNLAFSLFFCIIPQNLSKI